MMMKNNIDSTITDILSKIIKENRDKLKLVTKDTHSLEEFISLPLPKEEKTKASKPFIQLCDIETDSNIQQVIQLLGATRCTNAIIYPPNSIMEWHTNNDIEGMRTYYVYSQQKSIFRYIDPFTNEIINDYDNIGWTCRNFKIDKKAPLWHSVWSEGIRFSFGFNSVC
jgi:hypothetical protein